MSTIVKSKAIVLRKTNYGDSSYILSVFSQEFGKYSVIIKGARSGKSKKSSAADVLNLVELVIYKKENREMQFASQIDLINGYSEIKSDLEKMKYSIACAELISQLILDDEPNDKLFRGFQKILDLISARDSKPKLLFAKFFIFFIEELGYKININECSECKKSLKEENTIVFNFNTGFLCNECLKGNYEDNLFNKELFNLMTCLSTKKSEFQYTDKLLEAAINFFENYLKYHVAEFKGLQSLKIF
ncbi:MAG: hypothetical protein Fur0015_00020 [Ignavibacteriales bacterium]